MSLLYPDRIRIVPVTTDNELKTTVEETPIDVSAYVEEESQIGFTKDGTVIVPHIKVFIPAKKVIQKGILKTLSLKKGDMLIVKRLHGQEVIEQEQIRRTILSVQRIGSQRNTHIEVIV